MSLKYFLKIGKAHLNFKKMYHSAKITEYSAQARLQCMGDPIGVISFKNKCTNAASIRCFLKIGKAHLHLKKRYHFAKIIDYSAQARLQCMGDPIGVISCDKSA